MGREVWGTVSVKDHCSPNPFVREVLLFDRLVLPVPIDEKERKRWETNNWDPSRLDRIREILGTQDIPAEPDPPDPKRGWLQSVLRRQWRSRPNLPRDPLTWDSPWSEERWKSNTSYDEERWKSGWTRVGAAQTISEFDAFYTTKLVLAKDRDLPGVIEAIATFPSRSECRKELKPSGKQPSDLTAAQALLMLSTPLLIPRGGEDKDFAQLRAAADLAREARFQRERQAYYDWIREFVKPLQSPGHQKLDEVNIDHASLKLMEEKLGRLAAVERELLGKRERRRWWTRAEYALTVIAVGGTAAVALTAALPVVGVGAPIIGFGGWLIGQRTERHKEEDEGPLGGASMFVTAQRRLGL
jgi:hypothetical protein